MGATCKNRFVPSLELLGERVVPATIGGEAAPESAARDGCVLTGMSHSATLEGQTALEGHEALVFYLGGIPSRAESPMQGPGGSEAPDGRKFKPLFAPLVIGLDGVMHAEQARPTILLQRLANPSLPHSATGEREAGDEVRMPASTPSDPFTFARDVRGTGL